LPDTAKTKIEFYFTELYTKMIGAYEQSLIDMNVNNNDRIDNCETPVFINAAKIITYNFYENTSPFLAFFGKNSYIDGFSNYVINRIKHNFSTLSFIDIFKNAKHIHIIRNRYSILFQNIPLDYSFREYRKKWAAQYYLYNKVDEIADALIFSNFTEKQFRTNCMTYDWMIYKFYSEYYLHTKYDKEPVNDVPQYDSILQINQVKLHNLINIIYDNLPEIVFLQNIEDMVAFHIAEKNKYKIFYANGMAILFCRNMFADTCKRTDTGLQINDLAINTILTDLFKLYVDNKYVVFASVYIADIFEFTQLLDSIEFETRKLIIGITSDIDLTEEKYDFNGFHLSYAGPTTHLDKCGFHTLYGNLTESSGHYDYILSSIEFDTRYTYTNKPYYLSEHYPLEVNR
jgi:hypothetical protein